MRKLGGLTFHASHNYGSVLQAFALQEFIKNKFPEIDYQIINFRSAAQKEIYNTLFTPHRLKHSIFNLFYYFPWRKKRNKYEEFISDKLNITKEISSFEKYDQFDIYLSGSDQIWNPTAYDSSWHYFFDFLPNNTIKIAYAASFGPHTDRFSIQEKEKIKFFCEKYNFLSVREIGSKNFLEELGVKNKIEILPDPTLLLNKKDWCNLLINDNTYRLPTKKYILFYPLNTTTGTYKFVKKIEKILKIQVITTLPKFKEDFFGYYKNKFDVGPIDFLKLILNAELIISTSFHGCVFSSIFGKPFIALNVENDNRIQGFLNQFGMLNRNISSKTVTKEQILNFTNNRDFFMFNTEVKNLQEKAFVFLNEALSR